MTQEQTINDIAVKVGRLEVMQETGTKAISDMASSVNRLVDKLEKSDTLARKAEDKASSAHHRIDDLKRHYDIEIKEVNTRIDSENRERKSDRRWMIGTTLTAAGLIVAIIKLF